MEILKGLIRLLNKHRTYYRDNIGLPTNKDTKVFRLVEGLENGIYEDEDAAAQAIYGTDAKHINFKRLKYRLQNRLLYSLLLIDPEKIFNSKVDRAYFMVNQQNTICAILAHLRENKLAYHLAKLALPKAKIAFNPYAGLNLSLLLRVLTGNRGDQKKFQQYNSEVKYFQKYIDTEVNLSTMQIEYMTLIKNPKTEVEETKKMLRSFLEKIDKMKIDYSPRTIYFAYFIYLHDRLINRDISGTIELCKEGLKLMKPYKRPGLEALFYFAILEAHISLRQFEEGRSLIFSSLENKDPSLNNNLSIAYYYATLCLVTENYQYLGEALALFKEKKVEKSSNSFFKENFTILEMIYYIVVTLEKTAATFPVKSKVRISKFINDLPVFSKDKKGANTLILFVQLLLLIIKKDYEKIIDRVENLKAYDQKYLRKEDSFRITCFLRMILLIPKHNFHPVAAQRHAAPYLKKMEEHKESTSNWKETYIEMIPYENFWKLFIEALERNKE